MIRKTLRLFFLATGVSHVIAEFLGWELVSLGTKPALMALLCAYYVASARDRSVTVVGAIVCSFIGDVLLMRDAYFLGGLVAFLLAHLFYILAYAQHQDLADEDGGVRGVQRIRLAFPVVLAGTGLIVILYPVIGDLRMPVIVYALVITIMVLKALYRYGRTSAISFTMVFGGAVLFMISDSMIAIDKFLTPIPAGGFWIMTTYILAQFLIVEGLITHPDLQGRA